MKKILLVTFLACNFIFISKNVQGQLFLYGDCPEDKIKTDVNGNQSCSTSICINPNCDPDLFNDIKDLLKGIPGASTKPKNHEEAFFRKILNSVMITVQKQKRGFSFIISKKDISKGNTIQIYERRLYANKKKEYYSARKENGTIKKKLTSDYKKNPSDVLIKKVISQIFDHFDIKYKPKK